MLHACRQLFNAQTRKLQIAKEVVAQREGKQLPAEDEMEAGVASDQAQGEAKAESGSA